MCGIVAYIGAKQAYPILIKGLQRLEYRGYDSAGVALLNGDLSIYKNPPRQSFMYTLFSVLPKNACPPSPPFGKISHDPPKSASITRTIRVPFVYHLENPKSHPVFEFFRCTTLFGSRFWLLLGVIKCNYEVS